MSKKYSHILLPIPPETFPFTTTIPGRGEFKIPFNINRKSHSEDLKLKLKRAWDETESEMVAHHIDRKGIYLEFRGKPGFDLMTKSLDDLQSKKIRLLNVKNDPEIEWIPSEVRATVFVSNEKKNHFFKKIEDYAKKDTRKGNPQNADLINSIADIQKADKINSFWMDEKSLIPGKNGQWCEVWLNSDSSEAVTRFDTLLRQLGIQSKTGAIKFPERIVKIILANKDQLGMLSLHSDDIAEYRRAKETASLWLEMKNKDQAEWAENLRDRVYCSSEPDVAICILDTGVNNGHPLLSKLLSDDDCLSVDEEWGTDDHNKHGSLMAGIAGYGNLEACLQSGSEIEINHCLESVKILPCPPKETEPDLWGDVTARGIYFAEIQNPLRKRIICMAVSAKDSRDRGIPSSWSGQLDQLASGSLDDHQRLLIVCAGNLSDLDAAKEYPAAQITDSIHDPGQSWNALTVGSYTCLDQINDPTMYGYKPIASKGCLSPFSTTSANWENLWPIKPEIVMEGGNLAKDSQGFVTECDDLSILSTYYKPQEAQFYPFRMTSASTAKAAWFAAQLQTRYPNFWPETIRALMVHSAQWPESLKSQFIDDDKKESFKQLIRICGYGVPDLQRALESASNSLTLIAENTLQPYDKKMNGGFKTKEMHFFDLPWPKEDLLNLPLDTEVEMRITLSYFVEPGPGKIGWKDKYRYQSHGLKFHLNSPGESEEEFKKRINKAARENDEGKPDTESPSKYWVIGQARDKGSIHSDIWKGTAADLASSNLICVSPIIGWWRTRSYLGKWDKKTRYSLIVSISTPDEAVDIYTSVAKEIENRIQIKIQV